MLRSFVAWLDDYLADEGPSAVMRAVIGLLSFAALLGALLGSVAVKAGVIVTVLLTLLGAALLLLADRRAMRSQLQLHRRLVLRYGKYVDEPQSAYQVLSWKQTAHVTNTRGDTKEHVTVRVKVLRPEMRLIRLVFGCGWSQPARHRRHIKVNVRNLLAGNVLGTKPEVTYFWVSDGTI
jgi:hypothetical protein